MTLYTYRATIVSIYDGDTLTARVDLGFRISVEIVCRLNRIDTPELRGASREAGLAARDWLRATLPAGSAVTIQTLKDAQEKYGRWLADIVTDDGNINDLIVHAGHAVYRSY